MSLIRFARSASLGVFICIPGQSIAAVLIGNYTPSNASGTVTVSTTQQPAVSFVMPSVGYTIDSVKLSLRNYISTADTLAVGFYTDNSGIPGTLVGSLLQNPASASNSTADFTFLPVGTLTLSANTTYWLMARATAGTLGWNVSNTDTPTPRLPVGQATFNVYKVGISSGASYVSGGTVNIPSFTIAATSVPEPSEYAIVGAIALVSFAAHRKYRATPKGPATIA